MVFVTGHTGFKGSWLTEWLLLLGARVTGYSLPPPTDPALFSQLGLRDRIDHLEGDVRDSARLANAVRVAQPHFVFHLAAQSLVRTSYKEPRETYDINVMGTVNLLDALRPLVGPCAAVIVTSDKCYENQAAGRACREEDHLGGHDPYSSSKAAAEIAVSAFRRSFFSEENSRVAIATARAGNVIGGGDWAADRMVPDSIRALQMGESIPVRNPAAVRPWQHVLDPLSGYLELGAALLDGTTAQQQTATRTARLKELISAFNFGPGRRASRTVAALVDQLLESWPGKWHHQRETHEPREALFLNLNITKAARLLNWRPVWNFRQGVAATVAWYRQAAQHQNDEHEFFAKLTRSQIGDYSAARGKSVTKPQREL
jgi:CDP-glucose 4,6-dehydratase